MPSRHSSLRRREKPPFERFKDHCRDFTAFMFSNVGIILLVIFYTIGGAFIFQAIETFEHERLMKNNPHKFVERNYRGECLDRIWYVTAENISFIDGISYRKRVNEILLEYQKALVRKQLLGPDFEHQWSFSGAFLYSLTVITTIGYGNIAPRSDWGKLVTILYAIIGMPLFLLYLSNIGDVLAKSFKWIYSKVCLCRICPGVARRRIIRERRKMRQLARAMKQARSSASCTSDGSSSTSPSYTSNEYNDETGSSTQTSSVIDIYTTEDQEEEEDDDDSTDIEREMYGSTDEITVPLSVCVLIMISYILSGALLFDRWENWGSLNGSYFCFISLSSIGFGDLVPGEKLITADRNKVELSFIICAVYLLLGMALIAMCFNLMQEEVVHNIRAVKRAFKACFQCRR